ncbi:MAG: gliding motility protein GldN [Flavobacteriales bacterium]|nr:gliding motility protein GldN [Flavobacteriales bacterium]
MKNWLKIAAGICLISGIIIPETSSAQNVLDGVYVKEHLPTRRVTPYSHLREADVMWFKRTWRYIDLKEKLNLPFAYPKSSQKIKDRRNLFDVIHDAVLEGAVTAYNAYNGLLPDDEFTVPYTLEEVQNIGADPPDTIGYEDPITGEWIEQIITNELNRDDVVKFKIKEDWFFDNQRSVLEARIIGIAPVMEQYSETGEYIGDLDLYWVYFPELRTIISNEEVFNRWNDAERRTYDDIFHKRLFSSYIVKESNAYNRRIKDYKVGLDALLEAERVKYDIFFKMEHDLWEF